MKNKWIIGIIILIIACLGLIIFFSNQGNDYFKEISVNNFKNNIENNKTFILYVKQDGCSHCEEFTPIFKQVISENKVTAYYINLSKLSESEYNEFKKMTNATNTPTTIFYKDGKAIHTMVGEKSATFVKSKLDTLGYLK